LLNTELLFNIGLYKHAFKQLLKAKEKAYQHEKFETLLLLIDCQKSLFFAGTLGKKRQAEAAEVMKEREDLLVILQNVYAYERLAFESNKFGTSGTEVRSRREMDSVISFLEQPALKDEELTLSDSARFYFYNISSFLHFTVGNLEKSYRYCWKNVAMMERHPQRIADNPIRYLASLQNLLTFEARRKNFKEAQIVIQKARKIAAGTSSRIKNIDVRTFEWTYSTEIMLLIGMGEFEKGLKLVPLIETQLKDYGDKIDKVYAYALSYSVGYLFFIMKKYDKAKAWLSVILNAGKGEIRQDLVSFSMILNLLIHYEKGNSLVLEHFGKSANRYLIQKNRLYKLESVLIHFVVKKLAVLERGTQEYKKAYQVLDEEIQLVLKDPYERKALEYFDVPAWIESRIKGKDFADYLGSVFSS